MVQPGPPICIRPADEAAPQQQGDTLPSEGVLAPAQGMADPESITAVDISPSASAGAAAAQLPPEACQQHPNPQAVHEAAAAHQPLAQSPSSLTGSMLAAPAVPEADPLPHANESGARVASIPAEAADMADADAAIASPQAAPATVEVAVPAPANKTARASSRKPARRRKSRNPAARAPDVAPLPDQGQSRNTDATQRQLAEPGRSLRSGRTLMQDTARLASTGPQAPTADCVGDGQPPHLHRSSNDGHLEEAEGAPTEAQPRASHTSAETLDAPVDAATAVTQTALGCSKCRLAPLGCSSCRPRPPAAKPKPSSGRRGRKRAAPAPALADVLPSSSQAPPKGKKARLHSEQQPPAEAPEPSTSRATRASQRALSRAATSKDEESNDEQLAVRPMPASLRHRQQQKSSQAKAPVHKPPVVKATSQGAVAVSQQPSSSALAQTATLDSGASPEPKQVVPEPTGKTPYNLRRSARRRQSAQPAQLGVTAPQGVNKAAAQADALAAQAGVPAAQAAAPAAAAGAAAVAIAAASADPVAPEALRRSGRARRPARLQYDSVTEAQGSKSPPEHVVKARPARRQAGAKSASSRGTKRGAAQRSVISDSEDDNTSASTAAAGAGKSTATRKKPCRQQFDMSPIMEEDEEQRQQPGPDAASEFVSHRVHTLPETALHLAGLSPAEKRKKRRKAPRAARATAKSRLAASAETSQLQPEYSNLDAVLHAVEMAGADAEQDSQL